MSKVSETRKAEYVAGIHHGIAEVMGRENIEIAKTMLEKNVDINFISSTIGLPVYQLKSIYKHQNK